MGDVLGVSVLNACDLCQRCGGAARCACASLRAIRLHWLDPVRLWHFDPDCCRYAEVSLPWQPGKQWQLLHGGTLELEPAPQLLWRDANLDRRISVCCAPLCQ